MSAPLYALVRPAFPFPALAAQGGRAALGGAREVALAAFVTARLADAARWGAGIPTSVRAARAAAARSWLASLALPAATRVPFKRAVDATVTDDPLAVASTLRELIAATAALLDPASVAEVEALAERVEREAGAPTNRGGGRE